MLTLCWYNRPGVCMIVVTSLQLCVSNRNNSSSCRDCTRVLSADLIVNVIPSHPASALVMTHDTDQFLAARDRIKTRNFVSNRNEENNPCADH